jgi:hypothetical protein
MALPAIPLPDQGDIVPQWPDYIGCPAPDRDPSDHHRTLEELGWEFVYYQIVDDPQEAQPWFDRSAAEEYLDYQMGLYKHKGPHDPDGSLAEELEMNFIDSTGPDHRQPWQVSEEVFEEYIDYQMGINSSRIPSVPKLTLMPSS